MCIAVLQAISGKVLARGSTVPPLASSKLRLCYEGPRKKNKRLPCEPYEGLIRISIENRKRDKKLQMGKLAKSNKRAAYAATVCEYANYSLIKMEEPIHHGQIRKQTLLHTLYGVSRWPKILFFHSLT